MAAFFKGCLLLHEAEPVATSSLMYYATACQIIKGHQTIASSHAMLRSSLRTLDQDYLRAARLAEITETLDIKE